uniref:Uncharacterized protein n=1 Tax=Oryza nivara TaxID=4536 RepID=A0A0E0GQ83_ORYNI
MEKKLLDEIDSIPEAQPLGRAPPQTPAPPEQIHRQARGAKTPHKATNLFAAPVLIDNYSMCAITVESGKRGSSAAEFK